MEFKTNDRKLVYQGRVFSIRQDEVQLPNGRLTHLDIVEHPGAVVIVPLDNEQNLWFVSQYRHAASEVLLEFPAGTTEPGEELELCAHRELREEVGMAAGKLSKIGEFFLAPGYSTEFLHIYLATDLSADPLPGDEDEFIQTQRLPIAQAYALADTGQIRDAKTLATLMLARSQLLETPL